MPPEAREAWKYGVKVFPAAFAFVQGRGKRQPRTRPHRVVRGSIFNVASAVPAAERESGSRRRWPNYSFLLPSLCQQREHCVQVPRGGGGGGCGRSGCGAWK